MTVAQLIEWLGTQNQIAKVVLMGQRECGLPCGCIETSDSWVFDPEFTKTGRYANGAPYLCLSVMAVQVPRLRDQDADEACKGARYRAR